MAVEFLALELERSEAMESHVLVLHPGSHVGAGSKAGIEQIVKGLNEVLTADTNVILRWRRWLEREVKLAGSLRNWQRFMTGLPIMSG